MATASISSHPAIIIRTAPLVAFKPRASPNNRPTTRTLTCRAESRPNSGVDRRMALLAGVAGGVWAATGLPSPFTLPAHAEGYQIFYGKDAPPSSYGGKEGATKEEAKYSFEYPDAWKSINVNKVQKGSQGIDCIIQNPRNKGQQITVVTFGRAGEDNKGFRLNDVDTTIAGFAGADYDLQDALSDLTDKKTSERDVDGQLFYDIQLDSADVTYLMSVTTNRGKVYALFVKSPSRGFKADEKDLRHVVETFKTV